MSVRQHLYCLALGSLLAFLCIALGSLLTPPAVARWETQIRELEELRAFWAMIGIRHLPLFLLAIAAGRLIYSAVQDASWATAGLASMPYLLYVLAVAIIESLAAGETAFSWAVYQPSYFIWPHFVFVPAGLLVASRMVRQTKRKSRFSHA